MQDSVEYNSNTNTLYFITFLPYTVDVQNSRIHKRLILVITTNVQFAEHTDLLVLKTNSHRILVIYYMI